METGKRNQKQKMTARDLIGRTPSGTILPAPPEQERRLLLKFIGGDNPELDRIECQWNTQSQAAYWQQGDPPEQSPMSWTKVPQSLALIFLDYICADPNQTTGPVFFSDANSGGLATSLGNAISDGNGRIHQLFVERLSARSQASRVRQVFAGKNIHGKDEGEGERRIFIRSDFLAREAIELYWTLKGSNRITQVAVAHELRRRIRKSLGIEIAELPSQLLGEGGAAEAPSAAPPRPAPPTAPSFPAKPPPTPRQPPSPAEPVKEPLQEPAKQESDRIAPREAKPPAGIHPTDGAPRPSPQARTRTVPERHYPQPPPIHPLLFAVQPTNDYWPDELPLIELPDGAGNLTWTLGNAFEGILILGRTGSGKTTGSGFTFAEAFLRSGFGGLILTVKANEAERWRKLCAYCGREGDFRVVRMGGDCLLNVLAYEAQRPGRAGGLAENLTSFCRNLLRISTRSEPLRDPIWEQAGDQLLDATFELFLLAGESITFDRLADFVSSAPTEKLPNAEANLLAIPGFGSVFAKAKAALASGEDHRLYEKSLDYWLTNYATLPSRIRSSITLGIYIMFDAFRGRNIPDLISSYTNITPECIMAGRIVVIDLPINDFRRPGLLVQSAWKYLFQTTLQRLDIANSPNRRPVFLWEDEAQYFYSDHDNQFQQTARSSRVCRVVLTQNLPGFSKGLGREGIDAASSIFGNLNTKVFHNNSDPQTNEWAVKHFGMEIHTRYSTTYAPQPQPKGLLDAFRQAIDPPDTTSVGAAEHWEYAVRPEEFNTLRRGGPEDDFMVDAYITWMGLTTEENRHFTSIAFRQNQAI
jgi:hypothetical protein